MKDKIICRIQESIFEKTKLLENTKVIETVESLSKVIAGALQTGHKLILCGNGGSASDALHFAGEIIGRFQKERKAWPVVVLNTDVATMTAIANDYGYDEVYARQAEAHVNAGDIFIGISTSGNSTNVKNALCVAKENGAITAALLGKDGGTIKDIAEYPIIIPCSVTARIQECHILLIHIICEIVEESLA